ncbi:heme oxygenase [Chanos chanos]|uniref:heme oxygenase (biliverdin-producing) n=1 Tax=Chanos chanos TaxID=29144 RepID=A0A6J2W2F9_CHACN|nr:heme oxygenase-like [Chanos chanos]
MDPHSSMQTQTENVLITDSDLSEQIKSVTKDSHVRAENTELMLSYQRGQVSLEQYKLLLCSLYKIYEALEEALDSNASHASVAPIYFPQELARLESIQKDLEHFYGQDWHEKIVVPAATLRYAQRLREVGSEHPEYLVAHAYTRYLGDLSGGQVLGRITQKSLGLKDGKGLSFFSFPSVTSANRFKQLYRSRMNSIELSEKEREGVLNEAVTAFEFNIEVFDELQTMLRVTDKEGELRHRHIPHKQKPMKNEGMMDETLQISKSIMSPTPLLRMLLGVFVALAVGMGIYAF